MVIYGVWSGHGQVEQQQKGKKKTHGFAIAEILLDLTASTLFKCPQTFTWP